MNVCLDKKQQKRLLPYPKDRETYTIGARELRVKTQSHTQARRVTNSILFGLFVYLFVCPFVSCQSTSVHFFDSPPRCVSNRPFQSLSNTTLFTRIVYFSTTCFGSVRQPSSGGSYKITKWKPYVGVQAFPLQLKCIYKTLFLLGNMYLYGLIYFKH